MAVGGGPSECDLRGHRSPEGHIAKRPPPLVPRVVYESEVLQGKNYPVTSYGTHEDA